MSIDNTNTNSNSDMFGAPIWERGAKKKTGFGKSRKTTVKAEPIHEAPVKTPLVADTVATRPVTRPVATEARTIQTRRVETITPPEAVATDAPMFAAPIKRKTTARKANAVPTGALVAGAVAVIAVGAGAWYALQPRGSDLQMETSPATSVAALETAPASSLATGPATNTMTPPVTAPEAAAPAAAAPQRMAEARTRPAPVAAASADDMGVNTSATLPDGPQPYTSLNGGEVTAPSAMTATSAEPMRITPPAPAATATPATPTLITPPAPAATTVPPL